MAIDYKLLTYRAAKGPTAGLLIGDRIIDITALGIADCPASVVGMLDQWPRLSRAIGDALEQKKNLAGVALATAELMVPILYPGQIFLVGANYRDHAAEMARRRGSKVEEFQSPWLTLKAARACVVAHKATVELPKTSKRVDWEAELAVVIGREAKDVPAAKALDYVAGYTIANDLSARDLGQRQDISEGSSFRADWLRHKSFTGACPLGPWITPASQIPDPQRLTIKLWVNSEVMQDSNTSEMIFSVAQLIAAASETTTLFPGDVIITGTPAGVGAGRGVFLKPGDTVRIEVEKIGVLENRMRWKYPAPVHLALQVVEVDLPLLRAGHLTVQDLDLLAREFRSGRAGRFGQDLNLARVLQHQRDVDGFLDRGPCGHDAVVLQEDSHVGAECLGYTAAELFRADQRNRIGVGGHAVHEQRGRLTQRPEWTAGGRYDNRVGRMAVHHRRHVGTRAEDLGMDIDFAMAARFAGDLLALQVARYDVFHRHLVKANAVRLHEEQLGLARHADRNMATRHVAMAFGFQNAAGIDHFLLGFIRRHCHSLVFG